ncbi:uncharacterized protein LOC135695307 [Rhopilema esculentum]|uniref:uncharacterized protein LOC135695307 n=1 Tax=Rhopilema esculentum TaxID=499914 RepID=UPI0031CEA6C4
MKTFIICCIVAVISAENFRIQLAENGEKFSEEVKVDIAGNTEEIKVPQHQNRLQLHQLNDFNKGLSAMKLPTRKKCYISEIKAAEQRPLQMKESLTATHSRFPTDRYMVESTNQLVVRRMTAEEVGEKIVAHCGGYEMLYTVDVTKENAENVALGLAYYIAGKTKRSTNTRITNFFACTLKSVNVVYSCRGSNQRLGARCSFQRSDTNTCIYQITCPTTTSDRGLAAVCQGTHRMSSLQCCDFVCLPVGK